MSRLASLLLPLLLLAPGPVSAGQTEAAGLGGGPAALPPPDPAGAAAHYRDARRAFAHLQEGDAAAAEPLLTRLLERTPEDGELWYALGRARLELGDTAGAIEGYRASLEHGYRYAASVAYGIARLYGAQASAAPDRADPGAGTNAAASGAQADSAIAWLRRALDLRWGDLPRLLTEPAFEGLRGDGRFQALVGEEWDESEEPGRVEMWRRDIAYLVREAKRLHVGPSRPAHSPAFDSAAAAIAASVPEWSDDRMMIELGALLALLGDGHTGLYGLALPETRMDFRGLSLPLLFYRFTDGLFVVDAAEGAREHIGKEVVAFGNVPAGSAIRGLARYMHADNAMTWNWLGIRFLLPQMSFLTAIGASPDPTRATLTLRDSDASQEVEFAGGEHLEAFRRKLRPPAGMTEPPLWLRDVDRNYWIEPLPAHDALYFQFNQVRDADDGPSIAAFADSLQRTLRRTEPSSLILDLRHNNGGNNGLVVPLLRTLTWWDTDAEDHRLFVITGRNTFSAAQNFLNRLERTTGAIVVGEPSSSSPNFTGESTNLMLPYSRLVGSISNRYWQDSDPDDARPFIAPRVPVGLSSDAYFAGRDPALEAIFAILAADRE